MALNLGNTRREPPATPARAVVRHTTQQAFFLERLARLTRKTALLGRYLVATDRRMQLLNRSILSTYEDCRALGAGEDARALLESR